MESKQHVHFGYWPTFHIPGLANLRTKILGELAYLLLPEDTTTQSGNYQNELNHSETDRTRSVIKGIFWVGVSIYVSVVIAQVL